MNIFYKMTKNIFLTAALGLALIYGCAIDASVSPNELTKEYLDMWVKTNYPAAKTAGNGIYILEEKEGAGELYNFESFAMVGMTTYSMPRDISSKEGDISSTTDEKLSKQLGIYDKSHYYGPKTILVSEEYIPVGLYDMLRGMKKGGSRKALIPSWLMGYKRYDNPSEYIKNSPENAVTSIYEIHLEDFTKDIVKYQIEDIEKYLQKVYPGTDSTKKGFYYKQLKAPEGGSAFKKDTTIYINYTGRLLNGQVFDTTIKDTAKIHNIYKKNKNYKPVGINWKTNVAEISFEGGDSSNPISGFQLLLSKIGKYEKAAGVFVSDYGYKSEAVGKLIPGFAPLFFEVEVVDKPKEN